MVDPFVEVNGFRVKPAFHKKKFCGAFREEEIWWQRSTRRSPAVGGASGDKKIPVRRKSEGKRAVHVREKKEGRRVRETREWREKE